jgi:hypothetical protein
MASVLVQKDSLQFPTAKGFRISKSSKQKNVCTVLTLLVQILCRTLGCILLYRNQTGIGRKICNQYPIYSEISQWKTLRD